MSQYPRSIKRLIREQAMEAYERELARELARLDRDFSEWRDGRISSGELSFRIHQYEKGISRELFTKYNDGENDFNVAYAIVTGILDRPKVPEELIKALEKPMQYYMSLREAHQLRLPGE